MNPVIAVIDWTDASSIDGPLKPSEVTPLIQLRTVGWLVREDRDSVTVAQEWADEDGRGRQFQSIPRVNIRRMRKLKVPK